MLTDMNEQVQTSGWSPSQSNVSFPAELETRTAIYPSGNFDLYRGSCSCHSRPAAKGTRISNDRSLSATLIAGASDSEEPLLETHLPAATTGGTGLRRGSGFCALAVTGFAHNHARDRNRLLSAKRRFFEREL